MFFELGQSRLQPRHIKLIDGESANAALRASGATNQPVATAPRGFGESCVDDLNQFAIARGKHRNIIADSEVQVSCYRDRLQPTGRADSRGQGPMAGVS